MKTQKVTQSEVKPGDQIMPPARELSLWMRRDCAKKGLPEDALLLHVVEITPDYKIDKGGSWTYIKAMYSQEFAGGRPFNFFVRPNTHLFLKLA